MSKLYRYLLNARPASIGAVPSGFVSIADDEKGGRYGAIYYDRPLTKEEMSEYELAEGYIETDFFMANGKTIRKRFCGLLEAIKFIDKVMPNAEFHREDKRYGEGNITYTSEKGKAVIYRKSK